MSYPHQPLNHFMAQREKVATIQGRKGVTLVEKEEVSREGGVQRSSQPKSPVVVIACPVHKVKVRARGAGNGSVPPVSYLSVDVAHVEPLKIQAHLEEILVGTSERENK